MQNSQAFGTDEATGHFFKFFNNQVALLERLYKHQFTELTHLDGTRIGNIYPLLFSIWHTGTSVSLLSVHGHINECYILARSFLERIITYVYVISCDEAEYLRYMAYTKQKGYRILNRSFSAGKLEVRLKWLGNIDLAKEADLGQAVKMFTSEKGKAKTRWSSKTLSDMLQSIESKGDIDIGFMMLAILWIYDDASEALHGTLYGSVFHIGLFHGRNPSSKEELKQIWNEQFSALFLSLGICVHTLLKSFDQVEKIQDIVRDSNSNLKTMSGVLKHFG